MVTYVERVGVEVGEGLVHVWRGLGLCLRWALGLCGGLCG